MSFISAAPSAFEGSMNWYSYANGNPLSYIDGNGEIPILIPILVAVLVGGTIDAVITTGIDFCNDQFNWKNSTSVFARGLS